ALVEVVSDVGGEICLLAVGADDDAVLLVAEPGRAAPGRSVLLEQLPRRAQSLQGTIDRTAVPAVAEILLGVPAVELHAELGKVAADVGEDVGEPRCEHGAKAVAEQLLRARDDGVDVLVLV